MRVKLVRCGELVTKSEHDAAIRITAGLGRVRSQNGYWLLLTNLNFSSDNKRQSDEIDIVAVGPQGVRLIEVKHWSTIHRRRHERRLQQAAETLTGKAKRVGATLREHGFGKVGRVSGAILLTKPPYPRASEGTIVVRGVQVHTLDDWRRAVGVDGTPVLSRSTILDVGRFLAPETGVAVDGRLRLPGYEDLQLRRGDKDGFHRVYGGVRTLVRAPVELHLYDLSAAGPNGANRASRAWKTLHLLSKRNWAPSIVDSYQSAKNYEGELRFFSTVDPTAPSIEDRRFDHLWSTQERILCSLSAIRAVMELHTLPIAGNGLIHRNLTSETIRVREDNSTILTDFDLARLPAHATVAKTETRDSDWDESVAPEVRRGRSLRVAGPRSDTYSLCHSLSRLFEGREDGASRVARALLARGLADEPARRIRLEDLEGEFAGLLKDPITTAPAAERWGEGSEIRFRGSTYRVIERLGHGGVGIAFRVAKIRQVDGAVLGEYVAKAVPTEDRGRRAIRSHELAHSHLRHPLATVFEVAHEWRADSFIALLRWIPGRPLGEFASSSDLRAETFAGLVGEDRVLSWLEDACRALAILHNAGLTHGDVSPGNLIVSERRLVLTDYDCVTEIGERPAFQGSVEYSAPRRTEELAALPSDDIYSLAASFFHALYGRPPFRRQGDLTKELGLSWNPADRTTRPRINSFLDTATHPVRARRFGSAGKALRVLDRLRNQTNRSGASVETERTFQDSQRERSARGSGSGLGKQPEPPSPSADRSAASVQSRVRSGEPRDPAARRTARPSNAPAAEPPPRRDEGPFYVEARGRLVSWLRKQLIGPARESEELNASPLDRYPVGVLHAIEPDLGGVDPASGVGMGGSTSSVSAGFEDPGDPSADTGADVVAEPARKRRYVPPSSAGFSVFILGPVRLEVTARATVYEHSGKRGPAGRFIQDRYTRVRLAETARTWEPGDSAGQTENTDRLKIDVQARPARDGHIVTVTVCNRQKISEDEFGRALAVQRAQRALFEVELECEVTAGSLAEFPRVDKILLTEEEQELEFQYKDKRIYAVGHGVAVDWSIDDAGKGRVWIDFMPKAEVPLVTTVLSGGPSRVMSMHFLSTATGEQVARELRAFVAGYEKWIRTQPVKQLGASERSVAARVLNRMKVAVKRMLGGIDMLGNDPLVARAFRFANQAMLDQMRQLDRIRGSATSPEHYQWRPFQLAFLLTAMESAVCERDEFRDVLDLIWFPTGGGKTEAYLGLVAFLVTWRRMRHPDSGGGTAVLMRYTLRLLTKQQFERAMRMIFALEILRRSNPDLLGTEQVSVGIWVGLSICPNTFLGARRVLEEASEAGNVPEQLVLDSCPWCSKPFTNSSFSASRTQFSFHCRNADCDFGKSSMPLPCNVVDEALYRNPPTLLIATIDKFARLAWVARAGAFFGQHAQRPPELIIQDEVHLITGPLGSVAGVYETAVDTVARLRGVNPKYVASTATIRMASEQIRRLYARDVAVFPPPGLSCDDCYFARSDERRPARLYLGYLAHKLDQRHCLAPLAAALLMGPLDVFDQAPEADREDLMEAWWTQVIYHGTLFGVGISHNAYTVEVRDWARRLSREMEGARRALREGGGTFEHGLAEGRIRAVGSRALQLEIAQLTSIPTAAQNAETFRRLQLARTQEGHLDVVLATNMVSVGLDVSRLAVMVVNGQPLTTAEYIQASSRVGRAAVPGLVVANYFRHQARSLSHYELFRPYHESFYRFVEPSSVTPFTYPVQARALHAALVIVLRHAVSGLRENNRAGELTQDAQVSRAVDALKERCEAAQAGGRGARTCRQIDALLQEWLAEAKRCRANRRRLHYDSKDRSSDSLLFGHDRPRKGVWPTMNSMREVERTGVLQAL